MAKFKIQDQDKNQLIIETHYYKWLKENNVIAVNYTTTKREYLISQGFQIGIDFVSSEELQTLHSIEQVYFSLEVLKTKN